MPGYPAGGAIFTMVLWVAWLCFCLWVLIAFVRGMRALAEIPSRLERIEGALESRREP